MHTITTIAELKKYLSSTPENLTILDVRTQDEYESGHIPGAVNVDIQDTAFQKRISALDKEKTYLIYCQTGDRARKASDNMHSIGFSVIYSQEGFQAWFMAGNEIERGYSNER